MGEDPENNTLFMIIVYVIVVVVMNIILMKCVLHLVKYCKQRSPVEIHNPQTTARQSISHQQPHSKSEIFSLNFLNLIFVFFK